MRGTLDWRGNLKVPLTRPRRVADPRVGARCTFIAFIALFSLLLVLIAAALDFPALSGRVVDEANILDAAARATLTESGLLRDDGALGRLRCFVTDASRLDELAPRFLGEPLAHCDTVDI